MQALKTLPVKSFSSFDKLKIAVIDPKLLAPARVEHRGIHRRHPSSVWIRLRRHIEAACPGTFDQSETLRGVFKPAAVDMNDVKRRARHRRSSNYLLDRLNAGAWLYSSGATN